MYRLLPTLSKFRTSLLLSAALATAAISTIPVLTAAEACPLPARDYGVQQTTISVPESTTYRLWSRMQASGTNNSYRLVVDDTTCFTVGGPEVATDAWTWVGSQAGDASSLTSLPLTAGTHSLTLVGIQPQVLLDRVIAVSDLSCMPVADGSNCDVAPDYTPPTTPEGFQVTAPPFAQAVLRWDASTDAIGVTGYQIYRDGEPFAQTTATALTDTTVAMNVAYSYAVAAFDESGNISERTMPITIKTPLLGDIERPSKPLSLTFNHVTSSEIRLLWAPSTDNNAVGGYDIYRSSAGSAFTKIATSPTARYADTNLLPGTVYTYYVKAVDLLGNTSLQSANNSATTHGSRLNTTLIGYVRTATGQPIAGATVSTVLSDGRPLTLTTNVAGFYEVDFLANGSYYLQYTAPGYATTGSLRTLGENARIANNATLVAQ